MHFADAKLLGNGVLTPLTFGIIISDAISSFRFPLGFQADQLAIAYRTLDPGSRYITPVRMLGCAVEGRVLLNPLSRNVLP